MLKKTDEIWANFDRFLGNRKSEEKFII